MITIIILPCRHTIVRIGIAFGKKEQQHAMKRFKRRGLCSCC